MSLLNILTLLRRSLELLTKAQLEGTVLLVTPHNRPSVTNVTRNTHGQTTVTRGDSRIPPLGVFAAAAAVQAEADRVIPPGTRNRRADVPPPYLDQEDRQDLVN